MKKTASVALAIIIFITGTSCAAEKPKTADGSELLEKSCSVCHPSARPKGTKKTAEQWEATVTRMMDKGAKLSADEKKTLVDYLAKTYKP